MRRKGFQEGQAPAEKAGASTSASAGASTEIAPLAAKFVVCYWVGALRRITLEKGVSFARGHGGTHFLMMICSDKLFVIGPWPW